MTTRQTVPTIPSGDGHVRLTAELARSAVQRFGGAVHEEFLPELRGIQGYRVYNEMRRNEPAITTALRAIKWVIGQVKWSAVPGGDAKVDQEATLFLASCMDDMSETWSDLITDALTCIDFGWAWLEVVYKLRSGPDADPPSLHDDGRLGWRKFVLVGQDTLDPAGGWDIDETGGIKGLRQYTIAGGKPYRVYVPIEKSILFRLDHERNNPEGVSLLRSVYRPWYMKKQVEEIEAIGAERDATGTLVINLPVGATDADRDAARDILERYKADDMLGFLAPRHGAGEHEWFQFELLGSPGARQYDTDRMIKRYGLEIVRAFLAQFLMLGETNRGSQALSRDHRDLFHWSLRSILNTLAETINRFAVRPLLKYNEFEGLTALPQVAPGRILPGALEGFSKAMADLVAAGLIQVDKPVRQFVREVVELPPEPEEAETVPEKLKPGESEEASEDGGPFGWDDYP